MGEWNNFRKNNLWKIGAPFNKRCLWKGSQKHTRSKRQVQRFPCTTYLIPDEMWEGKRVEKYWILVIFIELIGWELALKSMAIIISKILPYEVKLNLWNIAVTYSYLIKISNIPSWILFTSLGIQLKILVDFPFLSFPYRPAKHFKFDLIIQALSNKSFFTSIYLDNSPVIYFANVI